MNIFYLDDDPTQCAMDHCDKHILKMSIEYAQILSTAHHVMSGVDAPSDILKPTHINHPCSVWVREGYYNYNWLYRLWMAVLKEYTYRYDKIHLYQRGLSFNLACPPLSAEVKNFVPPPQCVPDYCKSEDTIASYRMYYMVDKLSIAKWAHCNPPRWWPA